MLLFFHKVPRFFYLLCLLLCLFFPTHLAFASFFSSEERLKVSCFVTDINGSILMVKELATGKYRLPGGYVKSGYDNEESALWNLKHNTGFNASIISQLDQVGRHKIYSCKLSTMRNFFVGEEGAKIVAAWVSLLSSKKVSVPLLIDIRDTRIEEYEDQSEVDYFPQWLSKAEPSRFVVIKSGLDILPPSYRIQHEWLIAVREWILNHESVSGLTKYFPLMNSLISPLLLIIALPFFRTYYGFRAMIIYSAGLAYLGFISIILNQYLPIPPPYFVDLSFIPQDLNAFGFPSYEVTFFAFFFSWLTMIWPSKKYKKEKYIIAFLSILFCALSSIKTALFGESYPLTIFASIIFGIVASFGLSKMKNLRLGDRKRALISKRFWIWSCIFWGSVTYMTDITRMYYIFAFCLGITISLLILKGKAEYIKSVKTDVRTPFFLFSTVGLVLIFIIVVYLLPANGQLFNLFTIKMLSMFTMPVWILLLMPKIFKQNFLKFDEEQN